VLTALAVGACQPKTQLVDLEAAERAELVMLTGQLTDPDRTPRTRLEAAALLLNRSNPQAVAALVEFLCDSSNPGAQVAVARAIAQQGGRQGEFVDPLMTMLTGDDPAARAAAARALSTYEDPKVIDRVILLAADRHRPQELRLAAMDSLAGMLSKQAVATTVRLLDDPNETIRAAAAAALIRQTNIQAFGADAAEWKRWWQRNKDREQSQWLADMAQSLADSKSALESENIRLRDRLTKSMTDLYAATPPAQRDALLLGLMKDPLPEVRLAGTTLAYRRLAASEAINGDVRRQARAMLSDGDGRVRRAAALLLAGLGDSDSLRALLDRLGVEREPAVREALLVALGQLRDPQALPAVLAELPADDEAVAAAAADALARIAETHPLSGPPRTDATRAMIQRYQQAAQSPTGSPLREALLTAMGFVADGGFLRVMEAAMNDPDATVRLAAVRAAARLHEPRAARAMVPLASDADRGVRQAAIAALGALDGQAQLPTILSRTAPAVEVDAAVRQKAWDVAMEILASADARTLRGVADDLADREDARDQRIGVLQLLAARQGEDDPAARAEAMRLLGRALLDAGRPAEAEPHLAQATRLYRQAEHPNQRATWLEWIASLLASDDVAVAAALDAQADDELFALAMEQLRHRLDELKRTSQPAVVIALSHAMLEQLPHRLTADQRQFHQKLIDEALATQKKQTRARVAELVARLTDEDTAAAQDAAQQIQEIGSPAVRPLLEELHRCVNSSPDPQAEQAILAVLAQLAPDLNGYDPAAAPAEKAAVIGRWLTVSP